LFLATQTPPDLLGYAFNNDGDYIALFTREVLVAATDQKNILLKAPPA
jgi:hypothetical protein